MWPNHDRLDQPPGADRLCKLLERIFVEVPPGLLRMRL
jgi:hypothetical protein